MKKILPRKNISLLTPYQPGKPIEELQREFNIPLKDIIKLASNENPIGPSPKAMAAVKKELKNINRYPDGGCFYLKRKLAKKLGLSSENIVMGNGSDEIIDIITKAFLDEKNEVIISRPAFLEYEIITKTRGAKVVEIPVKKKAILAGVSVFRYDTGAILSAINKNTKIIFLGNPDNPTGAYLSKKELNVFLKKCPKHIIVVLDEAYRGLISSNDYADTIIHVKSKNVIILRTFSKAYGLAGLRVGYALANKQIASWMEMASQPFNVNMLAQVAASAALDDTNHMAKTKALTTQGKKFLIKNLKDIGCDIVETPANFILFSCKGMSSTKIFSRLLPKGIILRDMRPYGLSKLVRVTIGTMRENRRFIEALKEIII